MKLVRDRIPEIIMKTGSTCEYHIADLPEFRERLFDKLKEELDEFIEAPCVEEAADMWEVFHTIMWVHNLDSNHVELAAHKRVSERGGFQQGLILESVDHEELKQPR